MAYREAQAQLPLLCKTCGGPVESGEGLSLHCPYCGVDDRLPDDELDRVLELKRRVAAATRSAVQLDHAAALLADIFEKKRAFLRVQGSWLAILGFVSVYAIAGSWSAIAKAPPGYRLGLALHAAMGPMFVGGIAISFVFALFLGRISYRRHVRPLLLARPPRHPGEPARCRSCGAPLPDQPGPFMRCTYCAMQSLVTPEIQRNREALLAEEERAYRERARGVVTATSHRSVHMTRTLVICIVLVYSLQFVLAYLASLSFPSV